jgi:aminopeptidase N
MTSLALLLALFTARGDSTEKLMGPGVSRELATRRAAQISHVRYDMRLSVMARDTARGAITVRFTIARPVDVILDFRGPSVSQIVVNGARTKGVRINHAHLLVRAAALRPGENSVSMAFTSLIAPAGASIIRFQDETDGATYLYTLLVPSDANALFPCFDQPDLKARLLLSLEVPESWKALANGRTDRVEKSTGRATYHFRETDPLPTYLFAFAAGPWREFPGPRHTPLFVRTSRAREVEVDSLHAQVGSALASLSDYFGVPYPFQQFQFMLSPAFPFGGMEHPGATMFNEESFIYREPPTLNQRLGRRATIYHEVAHQWFGDYVTMRWFDDLWLKEGFATYMAAKMQEVEGLPNPWLSFFLRNKPAAYAVDQTAGTTPVWQQLGNLDQAKSNYGAIVYNKAPAILKQLNYLVGDSAFRGGVHDFLASHPYGNATWQDLLVSIGTAAHRSLTDWGKQYILRPGMPVIEQQLEVSDGRIAKLTLIQHPAQKLSGRGVWPMRTELVLSSGNERTAFPIEITAETTTVVAAAGLPAPDFAFANANDNAYGQVMLDPRSSAWLEGNIGSVSDPLLRAMLWGAMWDLVRDARLAPTAFIATAMRELPAERDEQISAGIVSRLSRAVEDYLSAQQQEEVMASVERLLLAGASDTTRTYGIRKNQLDAYINLARTAESTERLIAWLDSASAASLPLRQPTRWAIVTTLVARGNVRSEGLLRVEERRDTTTGGQRRAFVAGAARPGAANKQDYFNRYFRDSTLNEDWVTASLRAFNDPDQGAATIAYLIPALDSLEWVQRNRRIFFLGSWLGSFIGGQRSSEALARVDGFLAAHPKLPVDLRQKILQSRDDLECTVRIRRAFAR